MMSSLLSAKPALDLHYGHNSELPVISYWEMCSIEGVKVLERGHNFRLNPSYSVILLASRPYAMYENKISRDGETIECEGHDVRKNMLQLDPKLHDQQRTLKCGKLTQNGLFADAAEQFCAGKRDAELVRVYEKLAWGSWRYLGFYRLVGCSYVRSGTRMVFRFLLHRVPMSERHDVSNQASVIRSAAG